MLEMGQLKSDFDADKFTRAKEGPFIAHQFHFVMRQYSLALYELRRMLVQRERHRRRLLELQGAVRANEDDDWVDLRQMDEQNAMELLDLSIVNKQAICRNCEKIRQELIQRNDGPITNEQYQKEEPSYYAWFLKREALINHAASQTGIPHGVWLNMAHLEQPAMLDDSYQVKMMTSDDPQRMLEQWSGELKLAEADHPLLEGSNDSA
tara:strand:+ start:1393 stop:2016 length:624 start_codon:yes stop_codon:yes gene_type:complete